MGEWYKCFTKGRLRSKYGDIYEPYKKQEDISNELNPFKETDLKELD